MNIIKNTNGYEYVVLEHEGAYSLLGCMSKTNHEYVVAYHNHQVEENGWTWGHGAYFQDLETAHRNFKEKVGTTVQEYKLQDSKLQFFDILNQEVVILEAEDIKSICWTEDKIEVYGKVSGYYETRTILPLGEKLEEEEEPEVELVIGNEYRFKKNNTFVKRELWGKRVKLLEMADGYLHLEMLESTRRFHKGQQINTLGVDDLEEINPDGWTEVEA